MNLRLAIPIWNGRVSPVMDTARQLLVADFVGLSEISRTIVGLPQASGAQRARFICEQGIDTLICGAVSQEFDQMLTASGVKTVPWIRGEVNAVIAVHMAGGLTSGEFLMPGCGRQRRGAGSCCGRRLFHGPARQTKEE